jgi:hypothetical protein
VNSRCCKIKRFWSLWVTVLLLAGNAFVVPTAQGQLYENDSKRLGGGTIAEIARQVGISTSEASKILTRALSVLTNAESKVSLLHG